MLTCTINSSYAQDKTFSVSGQKTVLQVNLDKVVMEDFLGVNGVYHGFAWMPEISARGYNDVDRIEGENNQKYFF